MQKEREGSLRSLNDRREFRSYPEKLAAQVKTPVDEQEVKFLRAERDKMKQQLCRIEEDYQALKTKRLHDVSFFLYFKQKISYRENAYSFLYRIIYFKNVDNNGMRAFYVFKG